MLQEFKKKLKEGAAVFGPFMKTSDPSFVEIAGYTGFDFVVLDMEHGPVYYETIHNLVRGAEVSGTLPIIRTPDSSEIFISKALDSGALGVQIPHVTNAAEAKSCISAAKFHPDGMRGACGYVRAAEYTSIPVDQYFRKANEALVILQLEGKEAIDNLDEILDVKGFDILFIGPYDLSQSLGIPGQVDDPMVTELMESIVARAGEKGVVTGTFTNTPDRARKWKSTGVQYLSYSVDVGLFSDLCRELLQQLKSLPGKS